MGVLGARFPDPVAWPVVRRAITRSGPAPCFVGLPTTSEDPEESFSEGSSVDGAAAPVCSTLRIVPTRWDGTPSPRAVAGELSVRIWA
jgi:hypothetical protein